MKPILVVKIDTNTIYQQYGEQVSLKDLHINLSNTLNYEYHVFPLLFEDEKEPIQFQLLSVNNADEIDIEELKKLVLNNLKK